MRLLLYVLADDKRTPIPEPDTIAWAQWWETANRVLAQDIVNGAKVSTIFLGIDHDYFDCGEPVLWETMIFGGPHDQWQERYTSHAEAAAGHAVACAMLREGL
jgi:hypothetical protein